MTEQKTLKRRVRARMAKTGESYTAARRQIITKSAPAASTAATTAPAVPPPGTARSSRSNALVVERTGRPWREWYLLLQSWGARDRTHTEIARWLRDEQGVSGWWSQELTYRYELASGRRQPGQRPEGFQISVSKTVDAPVATLYAAVVDRRRRTRWLPDVSMRQRTATAEKTARFDWDGGATRLVTYFEAKGNAKSTITVMHEKLPDANAAAQMKAYWRERLGALKRVLEAGE